MESAPLPPEVLTKPFEVRLERAGMEAELLMVRVERFPEVPKRLVVEAVVEKKLVVVAEVPVAFPKVKFWRVVEPTTRRSPEVFIVVVALPPTRS